MSPATATVRLPTELIAKAFWPLVHEPAGALATWAVQTPGTGALVHVNSDRSGMCYDAKRDCVWINAVIRNEDAA